MEHMNRRFKLSLDQNRIAYLKPGETLKIISVSTKEVELEVSDHMWQDYQTYLASRTGT